MLLMVFKPVLLDANIPFVSTCSGGRNVCAVLSVSAGAKEPSKCFDGAKMGLGKRELQGLVWAAIKI
jgi:hypothetical protein